jgi:hypothetical protein
MPITVAQALESANRLGIPVEEFEKHVRYIKKGPSPNSTIFNSSLPIRGNQSWAFLIGVYLAAGGFRSRAKDPGLRLLADSGLAKKLQEIGSAIGEVPHIYEREGWYKHSQLGQIQHKRLIVYFSQITECIMGQLGVQFPRVKMSAGRKLASREFAQEIPSWITENESLMHSFVEGYLNTQKVATACYRTIRRGSILPPVARALMVRFLGIDRVVTESFARAVSNYLNSIGITGYFRFLRKQRCYCFEYLIHSKESIKKLSESFDIQQVYTKAKLATILASMDNKGVIFRIAQHCNDDDSLFLGYLLQHPSTIDDIQKDIRIGESKVQGSLDYLLKIGAIENKEGLYCFSPGRFKRSLADSLEGGIDPIRTKIAILSGALTYRCQICDQVVPEAVHCGLPTSPVSREHVLKSYTFNGSRRLRIAASLRRNA